MPGIGTLAGQHFQLVAGRRGNSLGPSDELAGATLRTNRTGAITAVYMDAVGSSGNRVNPPGVVGDTLAFAQHRLRAAGYTAVTAPFTPWNMQKDGCSTTPLVLQEEPLMGTKVKLLRTPACAIF